MGSLTSRFRNEEPVTDVLDRLEANIKELERDILRKEHRLKCFRRGVIIVIVLVLLALLVWYGTSVSTWDWNEKVLYILPLIIIPILFILIRLGISKYYNWQLKMTKIKLNEKKIEKRQKLEDVRNTAVYSVAKNILDRYDGPEDDLQPLI